ncbi:RHS repeat protein, partial [Psychrobacter sp. YGAH215]|uniref:RHS repeat domain-containing protein n=1 Tax=Psychrobacter sp. YGAH215 TaxID=2596826 RepID=UPI0011871A04
EYDSAGRVTKTSKLDDNGQVIASMSTTFDEFGRITKRMIISDDASPTQSAIHYKYVSNNPEDSRFSLIAKEWQDSVAANRQTGISYVYDNHGRPIEKTEFGHTPDGISISRTYLMSYDSKGNLTQVALRNDDNLESTIVIEAYTWFADGSVKTSARPNLGQITTFEHNANGQTTAIERKNNQETMTINIEYGDNNLPMTISRYRNGELINGVKYQRNSQGDITNVSDLDNNFIASYAYDDARRNLGEITAKQATLRHLDTEGRPIVDYKMSATGTDKLSYIYDNKNRITAVGRDDTQLVAVNYSADNKIAQILGASGEQTIVHNDKSQISDYSLPNMWDMLGVKKTTIKTVQSGVTRVEQNDNITTDYGVDDFGRISYIDSGTAGRKHYKYDARDQLTGIELANGVIISYQYDEKGRRVHKTVKQEGKVVQQVAWEFDDKDQLLSAKGSNQHIEYQYDNQGRVTQKRLSLADLATPLVTPAVKSVQSNLGDFNYAA